MPKTIGIGQNAVKSVHFYYNCGECNSVQNWWSGGDQFWLFTVYDKDQADDLTSAQRKVLKQLLKNELANRQPEDGEHDDH